VTKQQRLQHRFGQCGAVDRDERLGGAGGGGVDGARQHFLAGAGRTVDQHGDVGLRHPLGQREQRQRFGVGGGRHVGTAGQRTDEAMADRRVDRSIGDAMRRPVAPRCDSPPLVADDQRAGRDRRGFALGDQEQVARAGLARLETADAEPLGAQRRDQRVALVRDGRRRKD